MAVYTTHGGGTRHPTTQDTNHPTTSDTNHPTALTNWPNSGAPGHLLDAPAGNILAVTVGVDQLINA